MLNLRDQVLVILAGTTGSGKTTVAQNVVHEWPRVQHLESDAVRKEIHDVPLTARADVDDVLGGIYTARSTDATYAEMIRRGAKLLADGMTVILDGSFRQVALRAQARAMAQQLNVPTALVVCSAEPWIQAARLQNRYRWTRSVSDGRPEVLRLHNADWEPVDPTEADMVIRVDSGHCGRCRGLPVAARSEPTS
jgi:predicted kinase